MKLTHGYLSWCMPLDIHITREREEGRKNLLCVSDAAHNSRQPLVDIRKTYILSIILFKKLMTRWGSLCGSQALLYVASYTICKMRQEKTWNFNCMREIFLLILYSFSWYSNVLRLNIRETFFNNIFSNLASLPYKITAKRKFNSRIFRFRRNSFVLNFQLHLTQIGLFY